MSDYLDPNNEELLKDFFSEAQMQAERRRQESKGRPKRDNALLTGTVKDWFKKDYSPDQIAGWLPVEYPQQADMRRIRSIRCPLRRFTDICTEK
jgi:IS30 family transposase